MGPKSTAGKSKKGKADDVKSTKSKVSVKRRPPSVTKQASKFDDAGEAFKEISEISPQKVKSQTSKRYEEQNEEKVLAETELVQVIDESPGKLTADENIQDEEEQENLEIKEQTTKGVHLQSELDGQLKSMTGTMKNQELEDSYALNLQEGAADNVTDYKVKQEYWKSEVNDDLGILGDKNEEIQPVFKKNGIQEEHIKVISKAWTELLKKGELNIGRVFFKNIFTIQPKLMKLFNYEDLSEAELFKNQEFHKECIQMIKLIGMVVENLGKIDELVPKLIDLGGTILEKGVFLEDYAVVIQAMQLTLKAGIKQDYTKYVSQALHIVCTCLFKHMQYEWYTNPELQGEQLTQSRIDAVQSSWSNAKDLGYEAIGDHLFQNIFAAAPSVLELFSFGGLVDYRASQQYKEHVIKVASTLSTAVENLQNLQELEPILKNLGFEHINRGVKKEHYQVVMDAVLKTLKDNLGDIQFTPVVQKAWKVVLNVVKETMIANNYEQQAQVLPEDLADQLLNPYNPEMHNDEKYLHIDSMQITVQNTDRDIQQYFSDRNSMSLRSDRNEDTMRPIVGADIEEGLQIKEFGTQKETQQNGENIDNYQSLFKTEVDFHHKIAYRFEKAYRLGKKTQDRKQTLNLEIIDCISEHSGYIEQDPMALFYCLFFCIYFKNEQLVEFLRVLIQKIHSHPKIDQLLEYIDQDGIDKIRTVGEQINQIVYHMVLYQSIDDNLRIVYSQILRQLRLVQMRDKDALHLLNTRDFEMIRLTFQKYTTKIDMKIFYKTLFSIKASTYRKYNQAYYEEVVINSGSVDPRVAQNYRERFLVTADDIYIVFEMYCKEDYDDEFISTKKDEITHQQFIDLFVICIKSDSFKIGMLIYTLYLNKQVDCNEKMMDILMGTIKDSTLFHELKLFMIHEHFDILSIVQMNLLVDIYQDVLNSKEPKGNPLVSQYNPIKVSLLIYRICYKIEKKQIYSLITKCQLLQNYLVESLCKFFEKQNNILILYKFMQEPILHMTERKDSLDYMYEMNMQRLLKHPVVVEVLNLVYEGKYSVSSSSLSMSQTFMCILEMETMSLSSINEKIIQNVVNFGDTDSQKQTSLQYNIWKQSIQQRQQDEMLFTCIISFVLIFLGIQINLNLNQTFNVDKQFFGSQIGRVPSNLLNASTEVQNNYCENIIPRILELEQSIRMFQMVIILQTIGMFTSSCQKILIFRSKDNVTLSTGLIMLELSIFASGMLFIFVETSEISSTLVSDVCSIHIDMSDVEKIPVDKTFSLVNPEIGSLDIKLIIAAIIVQMCFISVIMLQRTQYLGELIMMLDQMKNELYRFFLTFGLVILVFLLLGRMLSTEFKYEPSSFFQAFIDLFNAFNGNTDFSKWTAPIGQIYIVIFIYMFKVLLVSLLAAMFINRYKTVWVNLDAYRRFTIIKLKNSISFDKFIGGVTLTFFPINIIMLPFSLILTAVRSKRSSDIMLKIQYSIMMILYCIISAIMFIPVAPILLMKTYTNSIFIYISNKREVYKGENLVQLLITIFFSPFLILLSIIIDLISLPTVLLKESFNFEHKYQLSADRLTDVQVVVVMETFKTIFYKGWQNYKNTFITLIELMEMHRGIFSLIDNLHDLTCRGNKDYKEALSNVQDYNMTKILTRMCSIPDIEGDYKKSKCDFNTIYAIQFDIELYNYVDATFRKLRMGILRDEIQKKERGMTIKLESKKDAAATAADDVDDDDDELKKIDGVNLITIGPDGAPMKRNNSDVMNNFFIDFAVRSFTDVEKRIKRQNNQDSRKVAKFMKEVDKKKVDWDKNVLGEFKASGEKYENYICKSLGIPELITTQETNVTREKKTESTHSSKEKAI